MLEVKESLEKMLSTGAVDASTPVSAVRTKGLTGLLLQFQVDDTKGPGTYTINSNTAPRYIGRDHETNVQAWHQEERGYDPQKGT